MEKKIQNDIERIANSLGLEVKNIKPQQNKVITFNLTGGRTTSPIKGLVEALNALSYINRSATRSFRMGTRVENKSHYNCRFTLFGEYFNGELTNNICGNFLSVMIDNNLNTMEEVVGFLLPIVKDYSDYAHITDDKNLRISLRSAKRNFLKFVYNYYHFDKVLKHKSEHGDLILFELNGYSFHILKHKADFIPDINRLNVVGTNYVKNAKLKMEVEINDKYVTFLTHINSVTNWIKLEGFSSLSPSGYRPNYDENLLKLQSKEACLILNEITPTVKDGKQYIAFEDVCKLIKRLEKKSWVY